jgi:two-component system cell cycle sensor histidine kinase/response regulator CckA
MPEMNGRNLAERVTTIRPHTRVLYMSGATDDALVALFDRAMSIALIQKPFTPDALARKVRAILNDMR